MYWKIQNIVDNLNQRGQNLGSRTICLKTEFFKLFSSLFQDGAEWLWGYRPDASRPFSPSACWVLGVHRFQPLSAPQLSLWLWALSQLLQCSVPSYFFQSFVTINTTPIDCVFLPTTCHSEFWTWCLMWHLEWTFCRNASGGSQCEVIILQKLKSSDFQYNSENTNCWGMDQF